jgi:hypothetical protein
MPAESQAGCASKTLVNFLLQDIIKLSEFFYNQALS